MNHGENCINADEYQKYILRNKKDRLTCKNDVGTCQRDICECDKLFAELHAAAADEYDEQFHIFNAGFVPEDQCISSTATGYPQVIFEKHFVLRICS